MLRHQNNSKLENLTLGKKTKYQYDYAPNLLQAFPRHLSRKLLGLSLNNLPFHGADIWTLYELSWLNNLGVPQVAIGHVSINADSINLIESKSFKLYLNSFNQTKFVSWQEVENRLIQDLTACVAEEVTVKLQPLTAFSSQTISNLYGECIDEQEIEITDYKFNRNYLKNATNSTKTEEILVSHLLKSNCLITHQPDWGSIQIHYYGAKINREKLLRYLVSFRHHNEFHEECVERIFCDILQLCQPDKLSVYARYTRRGGLDINPWRSNENFQPIITRLARQ